MVSPRLSIRRTVSTRASFALSASIAAAAIAASFAPAAEAATSCTASAARVASVGSAPVEPARANPAGTPCVADTVDVTSPGGLPPGVSLGALHARTTSSPGAAGALASVTQAGLGAEPLVDSLGSAIDLGPDTGITIPVPLVGPIDLDLRPALLDLIEPVGVNVIETSDVHADVTMSCVSGRPQFGGSSRIAALAIGGVSQPVDAPVTETVSLIDTQSIDPSDIDLDLIELPAGIDLSAVQGLIALALAPLPDISVPAVVAHVQATPNVREATATGETRRALVASVSAAGQSLASFTLAEASVSALATDCPTGSRGGGGAGGGGGPSDSGPFGGRLTDPAAITTAILSCTARRVVLTDVVERRGRVQIRGVAHRDFVGRDVSIRLHATGAVVARPKVDRNGMFVASAPLPRRSIRGTNLARYRATIGSNESLALKLTRRLKLSSTAVRNGRVTLRGKITRPFPAAPQTLLVKRRVDCSTWKVVKRVRIDESGRFVVRMPAPRVGSVAVLRLQTLVPWRSDLSRLTRTYTLPRYIAS
jgi:hypothetical protein